MYDSWNAEQHLEAARVYLLMADNTPKKKKAEKDSLIIQAALHYRIANLIS